MSQIIKPEGIELMKYLNEGYAICNNCGAIMDREENSDTRDAVYICPSCGWKVDVMDYEYEYDVEDEDWMEDDDPPVGCRACGGPYPHCKTSCVLFDE